MDRRTLLFLIGLTLLAGAVRVVVFESARPVGTIGDENYYAEVADNLARGRGHLYVGELEGPARAWRPPAHAWLLSHFVDTSLPRRDKPADAPERVAPLQRLQLFLGTLLVALTALLGRALFHARTGLLAAGLAALYPALVVHSHYLWSEMLFAVLVTAGLLGVVSLARRPRWSTTLLTGLVFGAATLTRELALLVVAACGLWWIRAAAPDARRPAIARAALILAIAALVAAPWTLRNHALFGRLIPVSTVGWFAAGEGNSLESPEWLQRSGPAQAAFHAGYFSIRDELGRLDHARRHALESIRSEQPAWLAKKLVRNLALLLNPDSVLRTKIRRGAYGDRPRAAARGLLAVSVSAWLALATLAALGIAAARDGGRRALACLILGAVVLVHVAANATPRFRVPWLPLLCIYASHALLSGRELPTRLGRGGTLGALAFLLFLFGVCVPYYLAFGGRP
jgi:4-amino-4-deoxy-L-arabinose transferase-like glycosyltransferase